MVAAIEACAYADAKVNLDVGHLFEVAKASSQAARLGKNPALRA